MELDPKYDDYDFPTVAPVAAPGHPGHLKPEEQAQVHQLRMLLEAAGYTKRLDTLTLLRFLRARKFNVAEAQKWSYGSNLKKDMFKYYPQYYHKTDKDGRPLYIEKLGGIDLNAMYSITTSERLITNLAVEYERLADPRLPACSRKAGQLLETCCTIMDLKGVTLTKIPSVYAHVKEVSTLSQDYYPERLGRFYLINAPWGFSTVWGVIKGWIDPVTVQKINVLGSGYQSELLKQVPAENLPVEFGGKCDCEGGCPFSDMGPWRESEWTKPAKWETEGAAAGDKKADEAAPPAPKEGAEEIPVPAEAVDPPAEGVKAPAPA
ncbi:unnamed protein product [Parascedosporium putredinis]|uniref:CRAL-TRIO domain-containing protein n=1 Tax=Parascedosporium putredinis TaxID=1442378 RepID=A0A9P1ME18_9PEZI|nr:unnamed protein product [Parascedosporium putredinis]CAI8004770.1 unnamed protein product [Parascedosporium putredinis]